jgi:hypothetical protein
MVETDLDIVIEFFEFITHSGLLSVADTWIETSLCSLTCALISPSFCEVLLAARHFISHFARSEFLPRPFVAEPML